MIKMPPGISIDEVPLKIRYKGVLKGLLSRLKSLYEAIYERYGEDGLTLIREVSIAYGEQAARSARRDDQAWEIERVRLGDVCPHSICSIVQSLNPLFRDLHSLVSLFHEGHIVSSLWQPDELLRVLEWETHFSMSPFQRGFRFFGFCQSIFIASLRNTRRRRRPSYTRIDIL